MRHKCLLNITNWHKPVTIGCILMGELDLLVRNISGEKNIDKKQDGKSRTTTRS